MVIAHHPCYAHPLPANHRFPMAKYDFLHGQLQLEGFDEYADWPMLAAMSTSTIQSCHTAEYWETLRQGSWSRTAERRSGFTWSPALVERESIIMSGSLLGALEALQGGVGLNIAGGTHHAFADRAEGFCLLNDFAIAARHLIDHHGASRILIVDLDVHQGNGTASITSDDANIVTFSMHGASNYPFHKEESSLDVALPDGTEDLAYLDLLGHHLPTLLDRCQPDVVFYQCGVDVLETDKLGKLSLTMQGCAERDRFVLESCRSRDIGVACAMGGGYSPDVSLIVEAHMQTFRTARELWS